MKWQGIWFCIFLQQRKRATTRVLQVSMSWMQDVWTSCFSLQEANFCVYCQNSGHTISQNAETNWINIHHREQDYDFARFCRWSKGGKNLRNCFLRDWNLKWNVAVCSKFCIYSFIFNIISNWLCGKPNNYCSSFNPMWFIDLGASNHMTGAYLCLSSKKNQSGKVVIANGEKLVNWHHRKTMICCYLLMIPFVLLMLFLSWSNR